MCSQKSRKTHAMDQFGSRVDTWPPGTPLLTTCGGSVFHQWKEGARNTTGAEGGGRRVGPENMLLKHGSAKRRNNRSVVRCRMKTRWWRPPRARILISLRCFRLIRNSANARAAAAPVGSSGGLVSPPGVVGAGVGVLAVQTSRCRVSHFLGPASVWGPRKCQRAGALLHHKNTELRSVAVS